MRQKSFGRSGVIMHSLFSAVVAVGASVVSAVQCPSAQAEYGWVAVAGSPSRESLDWDINVSQDSAEYLALRRCSVLQRADNCVIVASGPNCVAVAWDVDEPLNHPYGAAADTPADAITAAVAAAGPFANDPSVRCSYQSQIA